MAIDQNRPLYKNAPDTSLETARAKRVAEQYGFSYVDLEHFQVDHGLFQTIPLDLMIRYQFLPERRENGHIAIVVGDPTDVLKLDELELLLGAPLRIKVASPAAIRDKLQKSESTQRVLDEATEGFRLQLVGEDEDGEETLTIDSITQQESSPIIKLVDSIVFNAIQRRASDIHVETRDNEVVVKYRIDGVLYEALDPIDKRHHSTIISRIKVMSELDIAEKRVPQDGRFKLRLTGRSIDFRVSIIPSAHGEDCVIRILDKESMNSEFKNLRLDVLGFDDEMLIKFRKFIKEPYGMVLVTGPTGSGKTTTLYAALSEIQSSEDKIITIEDPVEYRLPNVYQLQVNRRAEFTFARALRTILRADPDIVMVGEIRDRETATISIEAALTGHLLLTTLHAKDAPSAIMRLIDLGVEPFLLGSALGAVIAQRLARRLCTHCREEYETSPEELVAAGWENGPAKLWRPQGCDQCDRGYDGRIGLYELLPVTGPLMEAILRRGSFDDVVQAADTTGRTTMWSDGLQKAAAGEVSLDELRRVLT